MLSSQKYYPEGATGTTGAGNTLQIWRASEFIHDTDPVPTHADNVKWKQIWPAAAPSNLTAEEQAAWRTAIGTAEPTDARKERIAFQATGRADSADGDATRPRVIDLAPIATDPISVVAGDGDPEFITASGTDDFTLGPNVYLGYFEGDIRTRSANNAAYIQIVDDADPSTTLIQSSTAFIRGQHTERVTKILVFNLSAETTVRARLRCEQGDVQLQANSRLTLVRLSGDPSSVAALEAQLEEAENNIAELEAVDATTQDIQGRIGLAITDILVGAHETTSWANAGSDAEGGIALSSTLTLDAAKAASYATSVTTPPAGSFYLTRVPAGFDPRKARTRNPTTHFGNLDNPFNEMRALGSDDNWDYYAEAVLHFGTLTLQLNKARVVGVNTWDGKLGPNAVASLPHGDALLWEHTAQSSDWHNSNGPQLGSGVSTAIYNGIGGDNPWSRLEAEVKWTQTIQSVGHEHVGLITFPGWRSGTILPARPVRLHGQGRIGGQQNTSTMNAVLKLVSRNDEMTNPSHLFIEGFNTPGDTGIGAATQITVKLWGVR